MDKVEMSMRYHMHSVRFDVHRDLSKHHLVDKFDHEYLFRMFMSYVGFPKMPSMDRNPAPKYIKDGMQYELYNVANFDQRGSKYIREMAIKYYSCVPDPSILAVVDIAGEWVRKERMFFRMDVRAAVPNIIKWSYE